MMSALQVWHPQLGHGVVSHEVGAMTLLDGTPLVFVHFASGVGLALSPSDLWPMPPDRADMALHLVQGGTA